MSEKIYVKFFDPGLKSRKYCRRPRAQTFHYKIGKNVDTILFDLTNKYSPGGGFYYTDFENFHHFIYYGSLIGFVTIPEGVPILKVNERLYKSPEIYLHEAVPFIDWLDDDKKHCEEKKKNGDYPLKTIIEKKYCDQSLFIFFHSYPSYVKFVKNIPENVQLRIIEEMGTCYLSEINNPTEKVQLEAVKKYPKIIGVVKNPYQSVILLAVENFAGYACDKLTESNKIHLVKKRGLFIKYITNPSEEVQMASVLNNAQAINYIVNPTEKVKMAYISKLLF